MEIITSHNALDFDGLAGMVAAGMLYPGAVKVFAGTLAPNVKQFMALYKDSLSIKQPREIDLKQINKMIIVDTANANRLAQFKSLAFNQEIELYIYDHHPVTKDNITGSINAINAVGAVTTILVEQIQRQNITVTPFAATVLALGIYEDTGSLLFSTTTSRDAYAAAFLLARGANLAVVANFMERPFSNEQRQILQQLLETAKYYKIRNINVVLATAGMDKFVPGLDSVTYRFLEMENCEAVFVIAMLEGKINVIGRSRSNYVQINKILKPLGGRGHAAAASAVARSKSTDDVVAVLLKGLDDSIRPVVVARNIMSSPVKTIPMHLTMEEAGRIMLRYGYTGMPVVEGDKVVGVISRRDVDKAITHKLGHAPVKGFMTTKVLSASPDTGVDEIEKIMVEYDIGRLPVIEKGKLVGIVSRTDILRILHGADYPEDHKVLYTLSSDESVNYSQILEKRLPAGILNILHIAGQTAAELGSRIYCVGGFVRDLLLQVANYDVDLVVDGDGLELSHRLAERLGGREKVHDRFHTAVIKLADGTKIDIATARTEYYEFPAALPKVEKSTIKEDMYRRDFTINTLAICLNPDRWGDLIDYFGGRKDLEKGLIRILYNLSFVEDPTRILRAIRFEQRYQFTIEPDTLRFARDAINRRLLGRLSYKRILQEVILILNEKDPVPALKRMQEIGVWSYILPEVRLEKLSTAALKRIAVVLGWWQERYLRTDTRSWLVYFMYIISHLDKTQIESVLNRYPLNHHARQCIRAIARIDEVAAKITNRPHLKPSELDCWLNGLNDEGLVYLMLGLKDEHAWDAVVTYLDRKEEVRLEINGYDLQRLGLKAGPQYKHILDQLYQLKLDGVVKNRDDEISMVRRWQQEGDLNSANN